MLNDLPVHQFGRSIKDASVVKLFLSLLFSVLLSGMINTAQAAGEVPASVTYYAGSGNCINSASSSRAAAVSCAQNFYSTGYGVSVTCTDSGSNYMNCTAFGMNSAGGLFPGATYAFIVGLYPLYACNTKTSVFAVSSTGAMVCVCNTGLIPDSTATACVPEQTCPINDLPPITDPDVLAFEANPNLSDTTRLTPQMQTALSCLLTAAAAGSPTVGSAYRPPAYNQHLIDVFEKWKILIDDKTPACASLKTKIQQHFTTHQLILTQPPVVGSRHTQGLAVDVTINLPSASIDALAASCGLRRPLPVKDRVHFQFP